MNNPKIPSAPKKNPPKKILPSSRYYTEENENDLTPENIENVKEVNLSPLVSVLKKNPGNKPLPISVPELGDPIPAPKMKLPPHLQGGKKTRRRSRRRQSTRRH